MTRHPLLTMIAALRQSGQHDTAAGLVACAQLARVLAPTSGLLMPTGEDDAVDRVALEHFDLGEARQELRWALAQVKNFERRDAIESAINRMIAASDETHYYLGLATGLLAFQQCRCDGRPHT